MLEKTLSRQDKIRLEDLTSNELIKLIKRFNQYPDARVIAGIRLETLEGMAVETKELIVNAKKAVAQDVMAADETIRARSLIIESESRFREIMTEVTELTERYFGDTNQGVYV